VGFFVIFYIALVAAYSNRHTVLLGALLGLFNVGFSGTQRIWYLRSYRSERFELREIWRLTGSFFWQFVRLGLLCFFPIVLLNAIYIAVEAHKYPHGHLPKAPLGLTLASLGLVVILDFALTFVVPALAFSTTSAIAALRTGIRMIGQTWPSSGWYVFAPGLTVSLVSLLVSTHALAGWGRPVLLVLGGMVALLFRGAIVPFYLRIHPEVGNFGSAHQKVKKHISPVDWNRPEGQ